MHLARKNNKIKILLLSVIGVLLVGVGAYALYGNMPADTKTEQEQLPDTTEPVKESETSDDKQDTPPVSEQDEAESREEQSKNQPVSSKLSVDITTSSVESSMVYIRTEIRGLYNSGNCTLTLTNGSRKVKKTSGLQPLSQLTTCKGFDIPTSELSKGSWSITLTVTSGGKTGKATGSINI